MPAPTVSRLGRREYAVPFRPAMYGTKANDLVQFHCIYIGHIYIVSKYLQMLRNDQ